MSDIEASGELIVATISGPDTYFDYQGQPMGLQYALVADFASKEGLRVRMETAHDATELINMLRKGEADIIAYPLSTDLLQKENLQPAGATDKSIKHSWAVRPEAHELAEALKDWYDENPEVNVYRQEQQRFQRRNQVKRTVRAPYVSREKGIISSYDIHFKQAAVTTGWDWRLIAAQCYQESGFDPAAVSWAGARGLMQIMPQTARGLGVSADQLYSPDINIHTAARFIKQISSHFNDIRSHEERIKFILAAYNGGTGHIRDAMALAKKYGRDATRWSEVAPYVKGLNEARYYRDPVVRYGYMIGNETYNYVEKVIERYRAYGGSILTSDNMPDTSVPHDKKPEHKRNRFSSEHKILTPEEMETGKID